MTPLSITNVTPFAKPAASPPQDAPHDPDSIFHAHLARLTMGLSPASMAAACLDWLGHLAVSPGKQQALVMQAIGGIADEPPSNDRRFAAPEWQQWPFDRIARTFLQHESWWLAATTGVHGVSAHHEQQVAFLARQILDMWSPSNFLWTNPEVLQATFKSSGANLLKGAQNQWQDTVPRLNGPVLKVPKGFKPGKDVAITPGKVVFRNHLIELIQYAAQTPTVFTVPVLIVPPWIMKFYILDLTPADSLVRYLVEHGHTVFIVSWLNPGSADRNLGMDDYLKSGLMAALDAVVSIVPKRRIQAVGYCLGGTLLSIAAAFMARSSDARLNSLTLLTSELDFSEPGDLSLFIDESQLHMLDETMADKGFLDGAQMGGSFALLNARDLIWSRMVSAYLMGHSAPVSDLASWNADTTRMPYRQHSEYLHELYRDNELAQGRYKVDGKPIALPDIRLPIFCLGTQRDTRGCRLRPRRKDRGGRLGKHGLRSAQASALRHRRWATRRQAARHSKMRRAATSISLENQKMNTNLPSSAIKSMPSLAGKKGLIVGIANEQSIAFGCAQVIRELGGAIAVNYMNAKAEPHVRPLAERLGAEIIEPLDVEQPGQMEAVFAQLAQRWGRLDFLLHAIESPRVSWRPVGLSHAGTATCAARCR